MWGVGYYTTGTNGVHFGNPTAQWSPRMVIKNSYYYCVRVHEEIPRFQGVGQQIMLLSFLYTFMFLDMRLVIVLTVSAACAALSKDEKGLLFECES